MYAGDPNLVDVPFKGLLSKEYASLRRDLPDTEKAQVNYPPGDPRNMSAISDIRHPQKPNTSYESLSESAGTTYLSTADSEGNMVSATPSTFGGLEQGMVLGDTGIVINCRGSYFWLDPDNANALQPRKRPRTTPCAFIILKDGRPVMTLGTPGGDNQIQSNLQVLNNIVDFELDVQEAASAPRFCGYSFPRSPWPHSWDPNRLALENRINREVASELSVKEHNVQIIGPWGIVNGFTPIISNGRNFAGGADPRRDAVMLGW
jgi:gamma-glutamyltranspeptidase/glutathione hydrolase